MHRSLALGPALTPLTRLKAWASRVVGNQCAVCRAWCTECVCEPCVTLFGQPTDRCKTCALALHSGYPQCGACVLTPPPLDACLAAMSYEFPWAGLVANFKFNARTGLAPGMALLMRSMPWVEPALETADWVMPMPLSPQRLQERGFNQAQLLAHALAPDKFEKKLLLRIKDTPPQRLLDREERFRATQDAFAINPLLQHRVKAKHIVLVDDVMTSGASLHAAAIALRRAGAAHITGLVFARTESN